MSLIDRKNVVLLGQGRAGKFHIQSIQAIPGLRLKCVVDVDEARAKRLAAELESDYATDAGGPLGQADVDAVIVASPTREHFGQIQNALKAGKPVFTEKPQRSDLNEIDTCFDLAKRADLPLLVGFNRRFDPSFQVSLPVYRLDMWGCSRCCASPPETHRSRRWNTSSHRTVFS